MNVYFDNLKYTHNHSEINGLSLENTYSRSESELLLCLKMARSSVGVFLWCCERFGHYENVQIAMFKIWKTLVEKGKGQLMIALTSEAPIRTLAIWIPERNSDISRASIGKKNTGVERCANALSVSRHCASTLFRTSFGAHA